MGAPQALFLAQELRHDEGAEDKYGSDQLQVIGTESPAQRHRYQQTEEK